MQYTYVDTVAGATVVDKNGNSNIVDPHNVQYKVTPSGTAYHKDTPDKLVEVLERLRSNRARIRVYLGDAKTGQDWEEQYDVFGTIGRSTGRIKIPLLINNSRSTGGGGLLDNCIVKIEYANKRQGGVIYQHPDYHRGDDPLATRTSYRPRKKLVRKSNRSGSPSGMGGLR